MANRDTRSNAASPIMVRWNELLASGQRRWYVRALHEDGRCWGYVHVRTSELQENRSFQARLSRDVVQRLRVLVAAMVAESTLDEVESEQDDGVLGIGGSTEWTPVFRARPSVADSANAERFQAIVQILQPVLIAAAGL